MLANGVPSICRIRVGRYDFACHTDAGYTYAKPLACRDVLRLANARKSAIHSPRGPTSPPAVLQRLIPTYGRAD